MGEIKFKKKNALPTLAQDGVYFIKTAPNKFQQVIVSGGVKLYNDEAALSVQYTPQTLTVPQQQQALTNLGYIFVTVSGKSYILSKDPANSGAGPEAGDVIHDVWIGLNFFSTMMFNGGDPTTVTNWSPVGAGGGVLTWNGINPDPMGNVTADADDLPESPTRKFVTPAEKGLIATALQGITAGNGITVNNSTPTNPAVSTDDTYLANNYFVRYNAAQTLNPTQKAQARDNIGVPEDFLDLGDTPNDYTGAGGKVVAVNSGETGIEFITFTPGLEWTSPINQEFPIWDSVTGKMINSRMKEHVRGVTVDGQLEANASIGVVISSTVNGSYIINCAALREHYLLTLTDNSVITFSNMITVDQTAVITITLTGTHTFSFPGWVKALPYNDTYDGTKNNEIVINIKRGGSTPLGYYSLTNLAI